MLMIFEYTVRERSDDSGAFVELETISAQTNDIIILVNIRLGSVRTEIDV